MSQKLTITIPDELAERLEPYRGQMNLSRTCSEALEREVSILEALSVELPELSDLIQRLKAQKADFQEESYSHGLEEAIKSALEANFRDFELSKRLWVSGDVQPLPKIGEERFAALKEECSQHLLDAGSFRRGWLDGMLAVWHELEDRL